MIFKENLTSKLLQAETLKILKKYKTSKNFLELGCGNGNISNFLIKNMKHKHNFFLSDISRKAIYSAKTNINYPYVNYKTGKWLVPWLSDNYKFDIILSDISSINDTVARLSDWYKGVVCNSGDDGLKNINIILKDLNKVSKKNTIFILPIISLSNHKKLDKILKKKFKISYTKQILWPLPIFFKKSIKTFENLKKKKLIDFEFKFNTYLAWTKIAICKIKT